MLEIRLGSFRELAKKANLSQSIVNQWLAGKRVEETTLQKLADGLDLTVDQLMRILETEGRLAAG